MLEITGLLEQRENEHGTATGRPAGPPEYRDLIFQEQEGEADMSNFIEVDSNTNRKCFIDEPDDIKADEDLTFILNLHGGGSHGTWQHRYFPAHDYRDKYRLIVATPSAATREPTRRWVAEADDEHLMTIVKLICRRYGQSRLTKFWLAGHSQGGMTSQRLLNQSYFADRVDGWLSLSGGRIGTAPRAPDAGRPSAPGSSPRPRVNLQRPDIPNCDFSFIYSTGEHEIESLPETSPWAEKYGAESRVQLDDVTDTEPGQIYDTTCEGFMTKAWGRHPAPGTANVFVYPGARDDRVIADVVRLDKGHTEGLEPNVVDTLLGLITKAPGGKLTKQKED